MQAFKFFVAKLFCFMTKGVPLCCISILFLKYAALGKNASCDAISLELYTPLDIMITNKKF